MQKEIPINVAKEISDKYGYQRIIILADSYDAHGKHDGWITTYNKDKTKCELLGEIGKPLIRLMRNMVKFPDVVAKWNSYFDKIENENR